MSDNKSVLLFSGGMDSFILNYLYKPDILLYIKTGCKYERKELNLIDSYIRTFNLEDKFIVVDFSFLQNYELDNAHIPLRNLLFLEVASFYGNIIYLGALKGETSKDKSKKFRRMTQSIISYCWDDKLGLGTKKKIRVIFPFKDKTKADILKLYLDEGGSEADIIKYTVSCYSPDYYLCGRCMSCFRRWVAEILNGIHNPGYNRPPILYYQELLDNYPGIWEKIKGIFTKEFFINLPSNIDAYKAVKRYDKIKWRIIDDF